MRGNGPGRRRGAALGVALGSVVALMGAAQAESNPFIGRWHFNRAASKLPAGEVAPPDMMLEFHRVDSAHIRWSVTITNAQGRPSVESFDTPANGEAYPINGDTVATFRLSTTSLEGMFKGPAGETDALNCALSPDQLRMTCNGTLTGTDGKSQTYVDVYDRK